MWASSPAADGAVDLFPRRPRPSSSSTPRRSSATSRLEQRRRDLAPVASSTGDLWAFDGSSAGSGAYNSPSAAATAFNGGSSSSASSGNPNAGPPGLQNAVKVKNHGVIGSYTAGGETTARMLWNRPEREEEEREEEALPSYLSYLQATSLTGDTGASIAAPPAFNGALGVLQQSQTEDQMETKSKELARALQDFIVVQMQTQGQGQTAASSAKTSASNAASTSCNCERRVAELERQMQTLLAAQTAGNSAGGSEEAGSALGDRVSTLEGRQSAFQSQLAQISKVLGVPVGKHGKSSQLKTLVQTLREEIDVKVQAAAAEVEAACIASTTKQVEELVAAATASSPSPAGESSTPSEAKDQKKQHGNDVCDTVSGLPFSTVLNALAEEHEASLTRLSTHFDERLRLEGSQRVALEGRVRARLGELEEWLQQVEGELGGSHFKAPAAPSSLSAVTDQLSKLQTHITELEQSWQQQRQEAKELSSKLDKLPTQDDLRNQLTEKMSELDALRESVAGVETVASSVQEETRSVARTSQGLKLIVEKLVRDTGSAEELLQQYVSTITHQVASVTRQYVSVRIRDNNRLLDATLRARVPAYVANESESFLLVRPESKKDGEEQVLAPDGHNVDGNGNFSFVLRENDEDGIRRLLSTHQSSAPSTISTTIGPDASAAAAAAGATSSA
ncbi:hypothetical protein PHYBOEH_007422 [Phytophthora boehmeriae]|uniref:Uncharacterized protein n=1 Tax=Phytophthora boehmeriae TaxID=109152 RepID=A0A8T1W7M1_9STRA|nr:hypothetical protein PHYBOEH_007422 [Phytophthora boehmeriae]